MSGDLRPAASNTPPPSAIDYSGVDTRLRGRQLLLARIAWFGVAGLTLSIFIASLLARLKAFDTLYRSSLPEGWSEGALRAALAQLGLSIDFFIVYNLVFAYILWLGCFAIAAIIFRRKSDDWMTIFVALLLITWPINIITFGSLVDTQPAWRLPIDLVSLLGLVSYVLFCFLFPDGRFVPRWTRALASAFVVLITLDTLLPGSVFDARIWSDLVRVLVQALLLGAVLFAQAYRYWRVSSLLQRQQTKWVLVGMVVSGMGVLGGGLLPPVVFPWLMQPGVPGLLYYLFLIPLITLCYLCIPISISVAILRTHLWDIDIFVNRALVYGAVTGMLALVYIGSVIFLQSAFRTLTGQESQLAIVASTLAIAALFHPLRRRIQTFVDRRFYRRKYDATKTLAAFNVQMRDEVELDRLTGELLAIVEGTMRPKHLSLWLTPDGGRTGRPAHLRGDAWDT
ncbi:MAG: hypothetical protein ACJ8CR_34490 [Roseiflexaceae bacterium]